MEVIIFLIIYFIFLTFHKGKQMNTCIFKIVYNIRHKFSQQKLSSDFFHPQRIYVSSDYLAFSITINPRWWCTCNVASIGPKMVELRIIVDRLVPVRQGPD